MIKVELHAHTSDDPDDAIAHSGRDLVDRALALGYGALAITLHDRHFGDEATIAYGRDRGLTVIPSVERTIEDRHVLLINVPEEADRVDDFDGVRALKRRYAACLVVAPHPWFPMGKSLGAALVERHADLWDAIEINAFYTRLVDFNRPARAWAAARGIPLVGNGDVHQLRQLGTTYSLVDAAAPCTADAICCAIREGRVRVESRPLTHLKAARIASRALLASLTGWAQ